MNALWITVALLVAGFAGWPVTALVFRLARTIDDKADAASKSDQDAAAQDPSADVTVDTVSGAPRAGTDHHKGGQTVDGELTAGGGQPPSDVPQVAPALPAQRILRGGAIIGVLERLGVCVAILTGQPVAIAYIVAIKGLGRFAELKETPVAAERFIIGTLTSMLWAAGTAAVIKVVFLQ
ncbi:hypothetical protein [Pseudarthrobacter cellobiosi]|uniref:hypothetical protein n=1 Tax=Pseudarthrobacter cellobiosi TaxID=2953654 RepID=UPI00208DF8D6|nr:MULTISPECIES: hypothetical protein [unclassified Pseudarthrobacter]MCO4255522.1 hypothetical protein [Pseudarthrobacter sp. HLT1-5]MCO4273662.1 hypothetical protein [Pseudarthrobacter sp. HLT3-5]